LSCTKVWDIVSQACTATLSGHTYTIVSLVISADGKTIVSGSMDRTIKVWDTISQTCIATLSGHAGGVSSVALSADSKTVISGSHDRTIKIWDIASQSCIATLHGHSAWIKKVALSADARMLVSIADDRTMRIWDMGTQKCTAKLSLALGRVETKALSAAISADGKAIGFGVEDLAHSMILYQCNPSLLSEVMHLPYESMHCLSLLLAILDKQEITYDQKHAAYYVACLQKTWGMLSLEMKSNLTQYYHELPQDVIQAWIDRNIRQ